MMQVEHHATASSPGISGCGASVEELRTVTLAKCLMNTTP